MRWSDLDFAAAELRVRRTRGEVKGKVVESTPKSARSLRTVDLDPGTIEVLRSRRVAQNVHRLMVGPGWNDEDYVFTMPDGRPWNGHSSVAFTLQIYAESLPGQGAGAANAFARMVSGSDS